MRGFVILLAFVWTYNIYLAYANTICLYGSRIAIPTAHDTVRTCGPHEICFSDAYVTGNGDVLYELGCRDSLQCIVPSRRKTAEYAKKRSDNTEICSQCCHNNVCNSDLCGHGGFLPPGSRGPICFTCHQQLHKDSCDVITQCSRDAVCALIPATGTKPMETRCMPAQECRNKRQASLLIIGRKRAEDTCLVIECCDKDVCNNECQPLSTSTPYITTTSTTISTTSSATTRTITTTTTRSTTTTTNTTPPPTAGSCCCTNCPDRWTAFQGSCYLFGHNDMHFTEAQHFCMQHNGNIVEVETQQENMFLKDFMSDFGSHSYWLGMTDEIVEGIWKWDSTDQAVQFADWGRNEPLSSGPNMEDCAIFYHGYNFAWADVNCAANWRPLCEKRDHSQVVVG